MSKTVRVVILVEYPYVIHLPHLDKYTGFVYELWQYVKQQLSEKKKYRFKESFKRLKTGNYTDFLKKYIYTQKYDLAIGDFASLWVRTKFVRFTRPYLLNRHTILVKKNTQWIQQLWALFLYPFLPIISIMVVIGIILGIILYKLSIKRTIGHVTRTITAIVGDKDFLNFANIFNSKKDNAMYMGVICIIIILSLYTSAYLEANVVNEFYRINRQEDIRMSNVHKKRLLCAKGYSTGLLFESYGATVIYKDASEQELIKMLDKNEYDGLVRSYFASTHLLSSTITTSNTQFGMEKTCFAVNLDKVELLHDLNYVLMDSTQSLYTAGLATKYFGEDNRYLAIL